MMRDFPTCREKLSSAVFTTVFQRPGISLGSTRVRSLASWIYSEMPITASSGLLIQLGGAGPSDDQSISYVSVPGKTLCIREINVFHKVAGADCCSITISVAIVSLSAQFCAAAWT